MNVIGGGIICKIGNFRGNLQSNFLTLADMAGADPYYRNLDRYDELELDFHADNYSDHPEHIQRLQRDRARQAQGTWVKNIFCSVSFSPA